MRIDEAIEKLLKLKEEYGNLEIVGADDYDLDDIIIQKYIKTNSRYNDIISRQTEDLDENYLEDMYVTGDYKDHFVEQGLCVKVY